MTSAFKFYRIRFVKKEYHKVSSQKWDVYPPSPLFVVSFNLAICFVYLYLNKHNKRSFLNFMISRNCLLLLLSKSTGHSVDYSFVSRFK